MIIKCSECGNVNEEGAVACWFCGGLLEKPEPKKTNVFDEKEEQDGDARWGKARITPYTHVLLGVEGNIRDFDFRAHDIRELVIGRLDYGAGESPAINLSSFGAEEKGVSRVHASLSYRDGSLYLEDKASKNGTFLNGAKIIANQPRVLRDGDDISLGRLVMRVTYEEKKA